MSHPNRGILQHNAVSFRMAMAVVALVVCSSAFGQQRALSPADRARVERFTATQGRPTETTKSSLVKPAIGDAPSPPAAHKPGGEGIKVHGHWKIEVRNPDGKLVEKTEFENSLVTPNSADISLSQMLSGAFTLAGWVVEAASSTSSALCPGQGYYGNFNSCLIVGQVTPQNLINYNDCFIINCFSGLTSTYVPYNSTTQAAAYFQLQGSFSPAVAGPLTSVRTLLVGCGSNSGPSVVTLDQCLNHGDYGAGNGYSGAPDGTTLENASFTATGLPSPLNVVVGQIVTITITFSFS